MMKIVATALRWTARILRAHERAGSPGSNDAPQMRVFFRGVGVSVDSWTLGLKALCHRHRSGPHPEWTRADSVDSRKGDSANSSLALTTRRAERDDARGAARQLGARTGDLDVAQRLPAFDEAGRPTRQHVARLAERDG